MYHLRNVIERHTLTAIVQALSDADWHDGRLTAGWQARQVKYNEQIAEGSDVHQQLSDLVGSALSSSSTFLALARPKSVLPFRFSRYSPGMEYGNHADDPVMSGIRTDLSITVFLSEPESYQGGELVIEHAAGVEKVKLPAGDAIVYPSSTLHRVEKVESGQRLVAVSWIRSLIRDHAAREILLDLDLARQGLFKQHGPSRDIDLLSKSLANLTRMWVDD
ncbi:Fe2+-dependent dioxygenase [Rhizobium lusitanum]|uniref:Fe2+-dependent dioxygenase n=1 Tax=Rhizobium lusitanum TaxID=293958 RepID=UPI00195AFEE1|nr:Fe2+-dependent dioxygenase [Rhizobium lusitanum]MBM7046172.1 Fe2+-dependent dioxygenase [Rhizobium lusitanum]